ncbi:cobyrinate a,c-diamide synthase [Fulvimarina sp. 2208YS6-2-32]|uniref:Hydrogenobyrinate a,c-diamide synthase n=1 Tax=Fulvimarina uroteuthidis TaxID=3098149 RepID=A0ABU5HXU7_9HYPH|nr:cobyrinate a,c-diamide synthase [Fulvimarina sp. 2208YS6-2-32]MDY8107697.1 cobyrinate a,c-diamide synthase [Fulvimarina sp. 2208YS6-2-32]
MAGLLIAAPSSGAGKTTVTLALISALAQRGLRVASAKAGPDYIDPAYHAAASGHPCVNLDPWAMRPGLLEALRATACADADADAFVVEGMMGLFDGAADGTGSPADLAEMLRLTVVLVVDCARQSHSVAALVAGFAGFRTALPIAGLILNRVGSPRHETLLREALAPLAIPVLACLPRRADLLLPERHLGLVQAGEHEDLAGFLARAADWFSSHADLETLAALARPHGMGEGGETSVSALPPLGQHIAIARDAAFAFSYGHLLDGWRAAGAELSVFSPLADEAPDAGADAIYLPGGYPELHAGRLAAALAFKAGLQAAARRGARIYGECGGYMALGEGLIDADGERHAMLGLLPLVTSFEARRLHLGYRRVSPCAGSPFEGAMTAHEFHYATIVSQDGRAPLFEAGDARGTALGCYGQIDRNVCGSFLHLIDRIAT